ncbi:hypothetical protein FRB94_004236 [Tulasnella sp. JGI-2019a]|nr:hypothetical protein FRB94_004236 [Tulasnella sp. JGI-2019a]
MPSILVYLVRHGETAENRQHIIQGQLDTQLNETGRDQARRLAISLKDTQFARVYSSDLTRAVDTANAVLEFHPDRLLVPQHLLRERYFGALQGKIRTSAENPPDVESLDDLIKRTLSWWDNTIIPLTHVEASHNIKVLAVGHGAFIASLIQGLGTQRQYDITKVRPGRILNSGITIIKVEPSGVGELLQFAETGHLKEAQGDVVQTNVDEIGLRDGQRVRI